MPDWEQLRLDFAADWTDVMRRFYPLIMAQAFDDAGAQLGLSLAFDLDNPRIQETLGDLAQLVRQVADTTVEEIQTLVGRQAAEGWSIDQLAAEIGKMAEIHTPNRARLIAVTETANAYTKGALLGYESSGVVDRIEWIATMDDRTTERCRQLHGTTVPLGDTWDGDMVPRFPGCRCAIAPVVG